MPPASFKKCYDCQTCLCCICTCGHHECFEQQAARLPLWMQKTLQNESDDQQKTSKVDECYTKQALSCIPPNNLYKSTTYKNDFCSERQFIDHFPLEQSQLSGSLKTGYGNMVKHSIYRNDFIPWSEEERGVCKAKLHQPDGVLIQTGNGRENKIPNCKEMDILRNYYCPPHCVGYEEESQYSCLMDNKDKFNIGPPTQKKKNHRHKPPSEPFEKFTSYKLDYKEHELPPKKALTGKADKQPLPPLSTDTSYRSDFICPPAVETKLAKPGGQSATLTVGDGSMMQQTTSMTDYPAHDIQMCKPFRPRHTFQPSKRRMETETTTSSSFPRWKELPHRVKPQIQETADKPFRENVRPLTTMYQEDFGGLSVALCQGSIVEKAGPNVLQPRFNFTGSEKGHDFFQFRKQEMNKKMVECPH